MEAHLAPTSKEVVLWRLRRRRLNARTAKMAPPKRRLRNPLEIVTGGGCCAAAAEVKLWRLPPLSRHAWVPDVQQPAVLVEGSRAETREAMFATMGYILPENFSFPGRSSSLGLEISDVPNGLAALFACMLASQSVETVQYNALVALVSSHLVSLECGVPVQHFTDGFRTNHEDIPRLPFTVNVDDVTHVPVWLNVLPQGPTECMFYGLGSDGTVGANKGAVKMMAMMGAALHMQAYFEYDAKMSSGVTISHSQIGPKPIHAPYNARDADFLALRKRSYVSSYDMTRYMKPNGVCVTNCSWSEGELTEKLPLKMRWDLAQKAKLFITDATQIAVKVHPWFPKVEASEARTGKLKQLKGANSVAGELLGTLQLEDRFPSLAMASEI